MPCLTRRKQRRAAGDDFAASLLAMRTASFLEVVGFYIDRIGAFAGTSDLDVRYQSSLPKKGRIRESG